MCQKLQDKRQTILGQLQKQKVCCLRQGTSKIGGEHIGIWDIVGVRLYPKNSFPKMCIYKKV